MMKTANLEKITVLNRKQASDRMVASTCNCSWRYDVHLPAKKSAYEEQKRPNVSAGSAQPIWVGKKQPI